MDILGADKVLDTRCPAHRFLRLERGIEMYASTTFPSTVGPRRGLLYTASTDSYSGSGTASAVPRKICVMDRAAKELIVKHFPELWRRGSSDRAAGIQPDAAEDTERMKTEVRKELGLAPDEGSFTLWGRKVS